MQVKENAPIAAAYFGCSIHGAMRRVLTLMNAACYVE
jgi:hypothetical protein